jgi:KRAB domain-containing zinc finger protein
VPSGRVSTSNRSIMQSTNFSLCRFSCQLCNLTFKKASYLRSHNDNMHKEKRYICDECGSAWATPLRLKAHIRHTHVKVRSFKCGFCDASFKTPGDVKSHEVSHQDRQFQCAHCLKKFRDLSSIRRHVFLHMTMTEATHKCNFCDRTFIQMSDMRSHQRDHTRTSHACSHCDKVYTNSSGLINHVDYHHLNIRYCCDQCGMIYGSKTHLYEHYFSHRGFKPYHCSVCPREEVRKEKMKTHLKGHNVKYDFKLHGYAELDSTINKVIDSCRRRMNTGEIEVQMKPPRVRQVVKQEKRSSNTMESASGSWC